MISVITKLQTDIGKMLDKERHNLEDDDNKEVSKVDLDIVLDAFS